MKPSQATAGQVNCDKIMVLVTEIELPPHREIHIR